MANEWFFPWEEFSTWEEASRLSTFGQVWRRGPSGVEGSMNGFLLKEGTLLGRFGDGVGGEHEWFSP